MKKVLVNVFFIMLLSCGLNAQTYMTKTGFIGFYSKTPFEDIKAENNQVYAIVDVTKKNLAFVLLLKGFTFAKELMQEHFNENYVESEKYPKATFNGSFTTTQTIAGNGVYNVAINGSLTLHGVTKPVTTNAVIETKNGHLIGKATFNLKPEDFNISIPSLVRDKIAKEIKVNVQIDCTPKM